VSQQIVGPTDQAGAARDWKAKSALNEHQLAVESVNIGDAFWY
jgi:hypothetical protein